MNKLTDNYQGVMLSKRANVMYIEHAKVILKDGVVVFLTTTPSGGGDMFNIPDKNTAFILLGKGTSISDAAVRKLSESNVIIGFCGSGGSPLFACSDITFMSSQLVTSPTSYVQQYMKNWMDDEIRLKMAKQCMVKRLEFTISGWKKFEMDLCPTYVTNLLTKIQSATNVTQLMGYEGDLTKRLYHIIAKRYLVSDFVRMRDVDNDGTMQGIINKHLNYGNWLAYGYAAVALNGLGLNHAFPMLHGTTRREALIFDVADIIKDGYIMPIAFDYVSRSNKISSQEFRQLVIEHCQKCGVLDILFDTIKQVINPS